MAELRPPAAIEGIALGPRGEGDHHGRFGRHAAEGRQILQQGCVGPMNVFDGHENRPVGGQPPGQAGD